MSDERVWLRHSDHGGAFHCPAGAVDDWRANGWVEGDEPPEDNPVVAENLAAQRAAAEQAASGRKTKTRQSRDGGTDTEEG